MSAHRPDIQRLVALADGALPAEEAELLRSHLRACALCREAAVDFEWLGAALADMGRAERNAAAASRLWTGVQSHLQHPAIAERLPLRLAGAWRAAADLARPAVAAGAVATLLGLAFGTWIAIATQRAPASAQAIEAYAGSNLVQDSDNALTEDYLSSLDDAGASDVLSNDSASSNALPGAPGEMRTDSMGARP